jgi:hypothetical protein
MSSSPHGILLIHLSSQQMNNILLVLRSGTWRINWQGFFMLGILLFHPYFLAKGVLAFKCLAGMVALRIE